MPRTGRWHQKLPTSPSEGGRRRAQLTQSVALSPLKRMNETSLVEHRPHHPSVPVRSHFPGRRPREAAWQPQHMAETTRRRPQPSSAHIKAIQTKPPSSSPPGETLEDTCIQRAVPETEVTFGRSGSEFQGGGRRSLQRPRGGPWAQAARAQQPARLSSAPSPPPEFRDGSGGGRRSQNKDESRPASSN